MFSINDLAKILHRNELKGLIHEEIDPDISMKLDRILDQQIMSTDMRNFMRSTWYNLAAAMAAKETCLKQSKDKRWTNAVESVIGTFIDSQCKAFENAGMSDMVELAKEAMERTFKLYDEFMAERIIKSTRIK